MKINGSLVFDASSASEIQNLRVQKISGALPAYGASDAGRLVFRTSDSTLFFGSAAVSNWVALATGGNAAALQTEVDAIETSLGAGINEDGTFNAAGFTNTAALTAPTSFTNAIQQIANYATANDTLAELDDVALGALASGDFLRYNGTAWVDSTISLETDLGITASAAEINQLDGATVSAADLNKLAAVTADAAELNILDGATLTTTELNFVVGVTSPIQAQLDGLQDNDAGLDSLAAMAGPGFVTVDATGNTFTARSLVAPATGLTITNVDGAGDSVFALANDLAALEGLATIGYIVRTGDGTAVTRAIAGTAGNIVVTNGNGVTSDTSLNLDTVTQAATGSFVKVTLDAFGRVTGNTSVVTADITALVDATYVNIDGDTMTGNLNMGGTATVTGLAAPSAASDAATKNYVDNIAAGLTWEAPVLSIVADAAALPGSPATGARHAVQDAPARIVQWDGSAWVAENLVDGAAFFNSTDDAGYVFNGTAIVPFTGAASFVAGNGLIMVGNQVNVNFGAGIAQLPSDEVGIDLTSPLSGGLRLQVGGVDSTDTAATLSLVLKAAGGLTQDADGLYVPASGITNAMLANPGVALNADEDTGTLALGGTLELIGGVGSGIETSVAGSIFTISGIDASTTTKGVASFADADFAVVNGEVAIKTAGVDNDQLVNSGFTISTRTGSGELVVTLGGSLTIQGTFDDAIITERTAGTVSLVARNASTTVRGLARFDGEHFSVNAEGLVSLNATLDDLTNVSGTSEAGNGDLLSANGAGVFGPVSRIALAESINLGDLGDVDSAAPTTAGQALIADGEAWQAAKIYHTETFTSSTTWTVNHSIGQQFVNVTVMAEGGVAGQYEVVIPQSITMTSVNQVVVTFNTAVAGAVAVMGVALPIVE